MSLSALPVWLSVGILALGLLGTWLVTRIVMPWAIDELYLSLDVMKDGTQLAGRRITILLVAPLLVFAIRWKIPRAFAAIARRGQGWMVGFVAAWTCAAVATLVSFATFSWSSLIMIAYFAVFAGIFAGEGYVRNGGGVFGNHRGPVLVVSGVAVGCCVGLSGPSILI